MNAMFEFREFLRTAVLFIVALLALGVAELLSRPTSAALGWAMMQLAEVQQGALP